MSRPAARSHDSLRDHESSLEDADTAAEDPAPRRAPATTNGEATPTHSASRREKTASGFFSFFRWFRKGRGDEDSEDDEDVASPPPAGEATLPPTPSSVRLVRTQSSSCGSIDTLFSTATVSSFAFVTPTAYRPYGPALAPEKWIAPGPDTDTYRHRVLLRERVREQDRGITLRRKYHLFGSDTQLRIGPASPEASPLLGPRRAAASVPQSPNASEPSPSSPTSSNSTFGRKKRRAPPPPQSPKPYNDYSLPSSWRKDSGSDQQEDGNVKKTRHRRAASESAKDKKAGAYCHVKGKRKAPPPPTNEQASGGGSLDRFRSRLPSLGRKKRPAPQPPSPAPNPVPATPARLSRAEGEAKHTKNQETQVEGEEPAGSINKLSPEERERLLSNIAKLKAHANRKSMGSPPSARKDFHVVSKSPAEFTVCNDSLKLERGVLKPTKDMPKVEASVSASMNTKVAPVSPRPWYKRSLSTSKDSGGGLASGLKRDIFKSLEKKKEKDREDDWMPEAGIPRVGAAALPPSDGTSVNSTASTASASSSRFNFFSRLEEKRSGAGEKRRSQLSMLANISELDREAAEIVQKEHAREQALAAAHDAKFYSYPEVPVYPGLPLATDSPPRTPPPNENVEVPKRSSAKELISLFNAIGNVTKVTVNTAFFSREGSGFFSRDEKRLSFTSGESVKSSSTTEKVSVRESKSFFQHKKQTTVVVEESIPSSPVERRRTESGNSDAESASSASSSSGVKIEEVTTSEEGSHRSRALFEAGRARRHHSPSPSIPTIAEQSESTTPASTLDPGSKRSSMVDPPAPATAAATAAATAGGPEALQHAKRVTIWACPRCTLENPRWRITCDACGRWRPALPDARAEDDPSAAILTAETPTAAPTSPDAATPTAASPAETLAAEAPSPASAQVTTNGDAQSNKAPVNGGIDWGEELKRYFPKTDSSQTKAKVDVSQTTEKTSFTKQSSTVVNNGITPVHTDMSNHQANTEKRETESDQKVTTNGKQETNEAVKDAKMSMKLALPSTFIGGRTKADEKRQGGTVRSALEKVSPSVAPSAPPESPDALPTKPDIDEVRKARLAFFNREAEEDDSKAGEKTSKDNHSVEKRKGKKAEGCKNPKDKEAIYSGLKLPTDETEKKKLKEMLKEMKDSLPRYSGNLSNGKQVPENTKNSYAVPVKTVDKKVNEISQDEGRKRGAIKKVPQAPKTVNTTQIPQQLQNGSDEKVEAIFLTSKTIFEETRIRKAITKPSKVSTSVQTASVVKKVDASPNAAALPVTVEEMWSSGVKGGVLYTSLGKQSAPGASVTRAFELIRAQDFATIEATKTSAAGAGAGGAATAAHVYANVPPSPRGAARRLQRASCARQQPQPAQLQPQPAVEDAAATARSPPPPSAASATASVSTSAGSDAATSSAPASAPASPPPETSNSSLVSASGSDSSEVERLTAQLTLPKGLADFKADLEAQPPELNVNTLAVNRLLRRLEAAIAGGQHHQAALLARDLARLKISCSVTRQRRSVAASPQAITVDMYVEDKVSHQGPIPLQVVPGMTVADLKQKVEEEFEIPTGVQRWILGKMLASDDDKTLEEHNVSTNGCPMFLYLVAPDGDQESDPTCKTPVQPQHIPDNTSQQTTLPTPPPPQKGGGWYFNHEDDRYSFCEDTESDMTTDDDEDEADNVRSEPTPKDVPGQQKNEVMLPLQPAVHMDSSDEEEEEEDADEDEESDENELVADKPTLVSPSAVIIHDKPVVIEPPASAGAQKVEVTVLPTAAGPNRAEVGTMKLGWKCPVCTLVNSPTRPGCAACTTERPNHYVVPIEYQANAREMERIRKETQGDQLLQAEAAANVTRDQNEHYQELVNLDNTDLVPNTDPFECSVCFTPCDKNEGVVLRECLHTFCKPCLVNTVQFNEEAEVKCPFRDNNYACDSVLQEREIKALVPRQVFEQHLAKSVAQAENKIGNTFHCKTPDCRGWCIFEDNVNEFRCPVCHVINCLTCQAVHEGLNCKQYQERVQQQSETNAEARRTKEMLEEMVVKGEAMACPTCQVVLMKKWGCDWLRCSMCKTEICWVTRGPRWGPGGKGDTTGGCQCGVNGVKCHPRCNYCH